MTVLDKENLSSVNGAALWMIPVGILIWYEYQGGKEAIEAL